jgi:hypothetical protein
MSVQSEPACQKKAKHFVSGGKLPPLAKRDSLVLLEDFAAIEMAVVVEVIVDRSMGGGEFLQGLYVSELRHRAFSPSERLVGILRSIVEPSPVYLTIHDPNDFHRGTVRAKAVGHKRRWPAITLHCALQELQRSPAIPALRGKNLEHLAFMINSPPQIVCLAVDFDKHLVEVPPPSGIRSTMNAPFPDFRSEHRTKSVPPEPHRFVADIDATLEQKIFYLPQ